jgi:hypothetical protein
MLIGQYFRSTLKSWLGTNFLFWYTNQPEVHKFENPSSSCACSPIRYGTIRAKWKTGFILCTTRDNNACDAFTLAPGRGGTKISQGPYHVRKLSKGPLWRHNCKKGEGFYNILYYVICLLVYTQPGSITNPAFWLATQPGSLRNGPWMRKKRWKPFVLQRFWGKFNPRRTKKTTKYDEKKFNGRRQNLNRIIINEFAVTFHNMWHEDSRKSTFSVHITRKTVKISAACSYLIIRFLSVLSFKCFVV